MQGRFRSACDPVVEHFRWIGRYTWYIDVLSNPTYQLLNDIAVLLLDLKKAIKLLDFQVVSIRS